MRISLPALVVVALLLASSQIASAQQIAIRWGGPPMPVQPQARTATYEIVNRGSGAVELFWINFNGREEFFQTIPPGRTISQKTFVGHSWVVRREDTGAVLSREAVRGTQQQRVVSYTPRNEVAPNQPDRQPTRPQPQPDNAPAPSDSKTAAAKTIDYLNQIRANPAAFSHLHRSLADRDVEARPALIPNESLQAAAQRKAEWMAKTGQVSHVMNINGKSVGMNQWMREAGYELADYLPNDRTYFECIYGEGGQRDQNEVGIRAINAFMSEGKDGGHVTGPLGRGDKANRTDIGVGIARSADGKTHVSVVIATHDPSQR